MSITSTVKKYLKLLTLLLLVNTVQAAVSFHAASTSYTVTGGTGDVTMTLPTVSNNELVLFVVNTYPQPTCCAAPWSVPSGWSVASNRSGEAIFFKIWHTGDSTTAVSIPGTGGFESAGSASYSGVDTTNPLDGNKGNSWNGEFSYGGTTQTNPSTILAPQVFPSWNNDMLIAAWFGYRVNGVTLNPPAGFTLRIDQSVCCGAPFILDEKLLSTGAATGDQIAATTGPFLIRMTGVQLLLKAASGGTSVAKHVVPTLKATYPTGISTPGTIGSVLPLLFPEDGDTLTFATLCVLSSSTNLALTGGTQGMHANGMWVFYKPWHTGDSTSFITTGASWGSCGTYFSLISNWEYSTTLISPGFAIGSVSSTALSATSVVAPSLALTSPYEMTQVWFTTLLNPTTWTLPGNVTVSGGTSSVAEGFESNPSNPTGTYTGLSSNALDLVGLDVAWGPVSIAPTKVKSKLF